MYWIVTFYKDNELIKQKNFKEDLAGARKFINENKLLEKEKGVSIAIFQGEINEDLLVNIKETFYPNYRLEKRRKTEYT